ncbi:MAG: diacylglycerol kinase family protein [Vicinamibacterales bacterium]
MAARLAFIVNPISGTGGQMGGVGALERSVGELLAARGVSADLWFTERPGHARELAAHASAAGASTVIAWGGDGTVNEVASTLAFTQTRLGIIPRGSGNGLARGLGLPLHTGKALDVALGDGEAIIDVGELDGRRFVNAAGVGLDAAIAHRFAADGRMRGLRRYVELTLREILSYEARSQLVVADGVRIETRPLLLTLANGRQFGNGAVIAPAAKLDDGQLDLVIAESRHPLVALLQAPMLFLGGATALPGVTTRRVSHVSISGAAPIRYHVDGEPGLGGATIHASVHAGALRVKVPAATQPTNR